MKNKSTAVFQTFEMKMPIYGKGMKM